MGCTVYPLTLPRAHTLKQSDNNVQYSTVQGPAQPQSSRGRGQVCRPCTSTVLYSTLLYSTVLFSTVLYCTVFYCILCYSTVLYCVLLCTLLYCSLLYSTVLYL